jgi:serine/threonine protein phosphatase PrpC
MENQYKQYLELLLTQKSVGITAKRQSLFDAFFEEKEIQEKVKQIFENQHFMLEKWKIRSKVLDIQEQSLKLPNAMMGKHYSFQFNPKDLNWLDDIVQFHFENLEEYGLYLNEKEEVLEGKPSQSGDFKLIFKFRVNGEAEDSVLNEKIINFVVNPDPKSLWKNLPSDETDPYWKADNVEEISRLGEKSIVVASKRGRSHANVGSFRDDDYAFKHLETSGWSVVVVADGAGSAKFARQGSKISCDKIIAYFEEKMTEEVSATFDEVIQNYQQSPDNEEFKKTFYELRYSYLCGAAFATHKELERFATEKEANIKDFHSTLIFSLHKKYDFGYVILTFGVGDCPIAVVHPDMSEMKLMNWLDVGEFGGGTRFITMQEIFQNQNFATRQSFHIVEDFKYLVLMTDGIYDAKFVVEANLEKLSEWQGFFDDLDGQNADDVKVVFKPENENIAKQLSEWMDFWSPGNHDDRTLAVVF